MAKANLHTNFALLKQRTINIIITLSLLCVLAVLFSQGIWIRNSLAIGESNFDYAVNEALKQVVAKMEKQKVYRVFNHHTSNEGFKVDTAKMNVIKSDSIIEIRSISRDTGYNKLTHKTQIVYLDTLSKVRSWEQRIDSIVGDILVDLSVDSLHTAVSLKQQNIDSTIKEALEQNGINTGFEYAVKNHSGELLLHSENFDKNAPNIYKTVMSPNSLALHRNELLVQIPQADKNRKMWSSSLRVLIHSAVFVLFIMVTFWLTIRTILKQKKISTIKNDFINNMTHEFKTPIATIGLAADALKETGSEQVVHFASIIKQESLNMNQKVETILQMALLEQQQVKLALRVLNVHTLLEQAQAHFELQLKAKQAIVKTDFAATIPNVLADALHLTNVFANVIDNALKYSEGQPVLHIVTKNQDGQVVISISDEGIGMSKEEQKRVFDKFYRAQSGNIHNTKGFGLGLSYALQIVQLHKGTISLESTKNKGTVVTISLPVIHE